MPERPSNLVRCPRCNVELSYVGTKKFHEGTRAYDFLGGLFELFKNREHYDVYVCQRCGRVEFFVDGLGEDLRGEPGEPALLAPEIPPPDVPPPEDAAPTEPVECLSCGATIDAGQTTCPKCGWTYAQT